MEAGHPVPTATSFDAGRALVEKAAGLGAKDLAICVFTGGSSALGQRSATGSYPGDKTALHRLLLASGMSIVEINTVRKHVSGIKGGRLARAIAPARIVNLTVSDVVGDPLDCITDPTVVDTSTVADALAVLEDYGLTRVVAGSIREHLMSGTEAESPELSDVDIETVLVTRGGHGSDAVIAAARARGFVGVPLGALIEGEAATVGRVLATLARESREHAAPVAARCGGSRLWRRMHGDPRFGCGRPLRTRWAESGGRGGSRAGSCGVDGVVALFIDTDGSDGGTDVAGGIVDWSTHLSAQRQGISLRKVLVAHETKATLEALGDAVVTGLTQTNANDLWVILIR